VSEDGRPEVLPNLHVRVDDALYLHVSTGATLATAARDGGGVPVCVTVTLIDGLVLARSAMHHSANYRCVVVHGDATLVTDPQQRDRVLAALVDHVVEGRSGACRPPSARELAATAVLRVPLVEVSVKSRAGAPRDDADDLDLPYWAGVVPLTLTAGTPVPDSAGIPLPAHISRYAGPARSSAPAAPVPA
jgi:nitroimidazol reductase NimA-like FMN-containing flavoprotein (pyridoxamine 5'-phosphate oxidase superfamily)